jgi:hypothetical protein
MKFATFTTFNYFPEDLDYLYLRIVMWCNLILICSDMEREMQLRSGVGATGTKLLCRILRILQQHDRAVPRMFVCLHVQSHKCCFFVGSSRRLRFPSPDVCRSVSTHLPACARSHSILWHSLEFISTHVLALKFWLLLPRMGQCLICFAHV